MVDLVCHGTPPQKYFDGYMAWIEQKIGRKIVNFTFRDKSAYGLSCISSVVFENGKKKMFYSPKYNYYYYYMKHDAYRKPCYNCRFASLERIGDFTIGDFWGIEEINPNFKSKNGVTAVLINTDKAMDLFYKICESLVFKEEKIEEYVPRNAALRNTVKPSRRFNEVQTLISDNHAEQIFDLYSIKKIDRIKGFLKHIVPGFLYRKFKQIL